MTSPAVLILLAFGLGLAGWLAARSRAWAFQRSGGRRLHSLPSYHGWYVALWVAMPALVFAAVWAAMAPQLVIGRVLADPAAASLPAFGIQRDTMLAEAMAVAQGQAFGVFSRGGRVGVASGVRLRPQPLSTSRTANSAPLLGRVRSFTRELRGGGPKVPHSIQPVRGPCMG